VSAPLQPRYASFAARCRHMSECSSAGRYGIADFCCPSSAADAATLGTVKTVVVIDDRELPRIAIRAMLGASQTYLIVGEANSGAEGVRLCKSLRPDLVLLDVEMPNMDGAATAKAIRALGGHQPTLLAWTGSESGEDRLRMIQAGGEGYGLKDSGPEGLGHALDAAGRGETVVPRRLMPDVIARAIAPTEKPGNRNRLTARELEVLQLLAQGQTSKEIAQEMGISTHSVDSHLTHMYRKLGVSGRGQAVSLALRMGVLRSGVF